MKKQLLLYLTVFSIAQLGNAQISSLKWAKQHGGPSTDQVKSLATDLSGNVIAGGIFSGTANFDPSASNFSLVSDGYYDGFISKLDANGDFLWAFRIGNANYDFVNDVATDDLGNIFVAGAFQETVDFGPSGNPMNLTAVDSQDGFVAKYDSSGNLIWVKQIGGNSSQDPYALIVDNAGNVYISGDFYGTVDFDPGVGTEFLTAQSPNFNSFILKLDMNGDFVWVKQLKGNSEVTAIDIQLDNNDNVFVAGYFHETINFDPSASNFSMTSSLGLGDAFFMKLNNTGDFVWAKQVGGTGIVNGLALSIDASDQVYITGDFKGTADFDPNAGITSLTSLGNNDAYLAKYDNNGILLWVNHMGGSDNSASRGVFAGVNNQVYVAGYYNGTVDFNLGGTPNTVTTNGANGIFIAQYDENGTYVDVNGFESTVSGVGLSVAVNSNGLVHLGGYIQGTVNFDPRGGTTELTSFGATDGFIIQLGECKSYTTDIQTACGTFTWIDGITYTNSNITATDTLQNAEGCDSIITLDLVINDLPDVLTTLNGQTITANLTGANYQWIDCDNGNAPLSGETNSTYTATTNGNYAVIVDDGNCTDTSACVEIKTVGLNAETESVLGVNIYPNPTSGFLNIVIEDAHKEGFTLTLLDALGRVIQSQEVKNNTVNLNMTHFQKGVYFVRLSSDIEQATYRVIKQ